MRRAGLVAVAMAVAAAAGVLGAGCDDHSHSLRSKDGTIEITVPGNWERQTPLRDVDALKAGTIVDDAWAMVISQPKTDLDAKTVDDYADAVIAEEKTHQILTHRVLTGPTRTTVGGRPALVYELTGEHEELTLHYLKTYVETPTTWDEVECWTSPSKFENARHDFMAISASLREVSPPAAAAPGAPAAAPHASVPKPAP